MSFDVEVGLRCRGAAEDGVIFANGGANGGLSLAVEQGRPVPVYNDAGRGITRVGASEPLADGEHRLRVELRRAGRTGAEVVLSVDDREATRGPLPGWGIRYSMHEPFDVGRDSGSRVAGATASGSGAIRRGVIEGVEFQIVLPGGTGR